MLESDEEQQEFQIVETMKDVKTFLHYCEDILKGNRVEDKPYYLNGD